MDPILGGAVAAGTVAVIYTVRRLRSRPPKTASTRARTSGASGNVPKRSLLVKAWNSSGAAKVDSTEFGGAAAELIGRAAGWKARRSKAKWSRRWTSLKGAAERSQTARRKRWDEAGGPQPPIGRAKPKPHAKTVDPTSVTPPAKPSGPKADPVAPKRHLAAVPDQKPSGAAVTATTDPSAPAPSALVQQDVPPDWALMIDRVANFVPGDDTELFTFMRREAAGVVAYSEGLEQARENCTAQVGLDPSSVAGFTAYSEHMGSAAERLADAYKTFVAVYGEVMNLAATGVTMPHNGRFWTSNSA